MYFCHFCEHMSQQNRSVTNCARTYCKHTNTLEALDIFEEILRVGSDLVVSCYGALEYVLRGLMLEVGAIRDMHRTIVSV